jgi:multicomponent K+:H+ antiporter subunit A
MAGVPLLNGFLSKEMFFAETLAKDARRDGMAAARRGHAGRHVQRGLFACASSTTPSSTASRWPRLPKTPHEAPFFMRLPVLLLVLLCIAVGLAPALVAGPLLAVAAQAACMARPGPRCPPTTWPSGTASTCRC